MPKHTRDSSVQRKSQDKATTKSSSRTRQQGTRGSRAGSHKSRGAVSTSPVAAAMEAPMRPALSFISLPVADVARSRGFYEALGLRASDRSLPECAFFQLNGVILGLATRTALAKALGFPVGRGSGVLLSHNVPDSASVDHVMRRAELAGATIVRPSGSTAWGWRMGCFRDPDGHLWEVVFNPRLSLDASGNAQLDPPGVW